MESLTVPVSVLDSDEASAGLLVPGVLVGICIRAAMSIVENVRTAMVFATVRLVFISIPLFWFG